jgi:hypothetical protein
MIWLRRRPINLRRRLGWVRVFGVVLLFVSNAPEKRTPKPAHKIHVALGRMDDRGWLVVSWCPKLC